MEEILNNWLQEKPKDKLNKELNKYKGKFKCS